MVAAWGGSSGGHGSFPTPGHHLDGSTGGGDGKWGAGQLQLQHGQASAGGQQQPQGQGWGSGHAGEIRCKGKEKRSKQDSSNNSINGNHWEQVRDARFVGPEGHPPGTDPMYNAVGYPPNLRRPQGVETAIDGHDPRPRHFRCRMIGHVAAQCRAEITAKLTEDPNPPRNVYFDQGHLVSSVPPLLPTPASTPQLDATAPQQQHFQQQQARQQQEQPQVQQRQQQAHQHQ